MRSRRSNHVSPTIAMASASAAADTWNRGCLEAAVPSELFNRGIRLMSGNTGDHALLPDLMMAAGSGCSPAEFQAQLEEPSYEPVDRLIVRHGGAMVGHARLARRQMHYGPLRLPVTEVADLVVLPEYATWGLAELLLRETERRMRSDGSLVGVIRAADPAPCAAEGWSIRGRQCYSIAHCRDVLSLLRELEQQRRPRLVLVTEEIADDSLNVRLFRQVELDALMRLFAANLPNAYGWYARDEAYWKWLTCRRGYDRIYVASRGDSHGTLEESASAIVAYAVMRHDQIVEMMAGAGEHVALCELLERAALDAMEWGFQDIRFDGPLDAPLHQWLRDAGGETREPAFDAGHSRRLKLLDPQAFLTQIGSLLAERVRGAGLALPVELGLQLNRNRYQLKVGCDSVGLQPGRLGRSYLELDPDMLWRVFWGATSIDKMLASGAATASTQVAVQLAEALFPRLPLWHPPWDDLPGR